MSVKASDHFNPGWNARVRSGRSKNFAMSTDALRATHPMRMPIENPSDVIRSFDEITYQKGGAVLFMLETYLGEQVFRDGLRQYLIGASIRQRHCRKSLDGNGKSLGKAIEWDGS